MLLYIAIIVIVIIILIISVFIYLTYKFPGLLIRNCTTTTDNNNIIQEYKLFNSNEVETIKQSIENIRKSKIVRNSVMSTIGTPLYIDSMKCSNYQYNKEYYNKLLKDELDWMYSKLLNKLSKVAGKECIYSDKLSLPGFHIFEAQSWLGSGWSVASLHVDKQFNNINFGNLDKLNVFSFTIGLKLPKGNSLYYYNALESDITSRKIPAVASLWNKPLHKITYKIGKLYIHDGLHFHMISDFNSVDSNDERITLQGHGIYDRDSDKYIIYW